MWEIFFKKTYFTKPTNWGWFIAPIRTDFGGGLLWLPRCYNLPGCNASWIVYPLFD